MKQIFMALALLCGVNLTACAQKQKTQPMTHDVKILVAYFSATGTTAEAAAKLARVTGGELFAVTPRQAYTAADLDWHDKQSRSSVEMNDEKARPALKTKKTDMAAYDVVFIGYPIWWGVAPKFFSSMIPSRLGMAASLNISHTWSPTKSIRASEWLTMWCTLSALNS